MEENKQPKKSVTKYKRILQSLLGPINWFRRTRLRNKIIIVVALLIIGSVGSRAFSKNEGDQYVTETASRGNVVQIVSETGEINRGGATDVYSPTNGVVEEVYVKNGDVVKTGDELFTVVSSATEQEKAAAYSTYLKAKAALDSAGASQHSLQSTMFSAWDSYRDYAEDHTSDEDRKLAEFNILQQAWLAAEANYKNQQTVVSQARASVSSTWLAYQATQNSTVKATADGIVANTSIVPGGDVDAYIQAAPSMPAMVITPQSENTYVEVDINEIDIPKIEVGQEAKVEVDAIDGKTFSGKVVRFDSVGTTTQGVVTYAVYIELSRINPEMRAGMTSSVDITTKSKKNVLSVSNSAVKPYQGGKAVQVVRDGKLEYIPVKAGIKGESRTEILDGLEEGQKIVVGIKNEALQRQGPLGF